MGAYIINIPDTVDTIIYVNIGDVYDGKTYIASQRVEDLTPYTKPDMEQAQKEAYQKGYSEGCDAKFRRLTGSEYQRGLSDAWEAAKKICDMKWKKRREVFGTDVYADIIALLSASECIEKIRQYEQEKEEIIDPDKNKVEALANDIGIHKLFALVKEIRGE